jgi:hypothetical protein
VLPQGRFQLPGGINRRTGRTDILESVISTYCGMATTILEITIVAAVICKRLRPSYNGRVVLEEPMI